MIALDLLLYICVKPNLMFYMYFQLYELIHTMFRKNIKFVRAEKTIELNFHEFFMSKCIISYHYCVESPQQNSVVERKHEHILNISRYLAFQSNIFLIYWSACVLTTVYLIIQALSPLSS